MSEVYKFAAMSEVEVLEAPTDTTTLLAVESGSVKQIPSSGFSTGSADGSGFVVRGTIDMNTYAVTADKTYGEVVAAVEKGCAPVLILPVGGPITFVPLVAVDDLGTLRFALNHSVFKLEVTCTAENAWALVMTD